MSDQVTSKRTTHPLRGSGRIKLVVSTDSGYTAHEVDTLTEAASQLDGLLGTLIERSGQQQAVETFSRLVAGAHDAADRPSTRTTGLTRSRRRDLLASGTFTGPELLALERELLAGDLDRAIIETDLQPTANALSPAEVHARTGLSESRISHRAREGSLYSFTRDRARLYPEWQFEGSAVLPGLAAVVAAIPDEMHPAVVQGLMTTPQPTLVGADGPESPRDWLLHGQDADAVVAIIDGHRVR